MNKLKKITTILEHLDNADMNMKTTITSLTLLMVLLYVVTTTFCECSANPASQPQQQQSSNATTQNHYKIVGPNTSIGPILGWKTSPFMETLYIIMAFFLIIFVFRLLWAFLPKRLHFLHAYVPESGLLIVIGMIIGGFVALAKAHQFNDVLTFNESIFFLLLVPPIIFQSGFSLHKSFFFRNIGLILLYAFLGTFLDAMFLSLTLWGFSHIPGLFNVKYELLQLFMFGAAVSSVDPVAILTVFEDVKVNERLNIIILGQSVINDAVAAVLSGLFTSLYLTEVLSGAPVTITGEHVGLAIAKLLWMSLGAVIVGSLVAFIGLFLSRFSNRIVVLECTIVMLVPWATYLFSESLLVSGIIGVLCCGIILSNYLGLNMTEKNQETASTVLKLFSLMLEAMIFLYIGVSIVAIPLHWDGFFILFALVFTILFRYVIIFGLTGIYNLVETVRKTNRTVSLKNQFIIAYGGLRGAIAFALIFVIPSNEVFKRSFLSAILVIILFTVFVMGGTIGLLLKLLRIPGMSRSQQETRDAIQRNMNSIKEYEALIYRALNSLKRFRDKKEEGWNDSRETLRLTSTKIEQLISILKKDGTIDFQNQQHLTPRNVIALRRNAKRQVVSSWSTFLKGQPVENLPNAVLAVHRVFETISKGHSNHQVGIDHIFHDEMDENLVLFLTQHGVLVQHSPMSHNNPPSISGRVHTTIDVEPSCNDKSFLLYLERILSVHIIIDWQRRLQEVMRVRTEGEAILPSHWEVLLSSIINILNVVLDKGQTEISELDKISFSGSVFGIILESTTSAAEDIAGVGQWSRGFKKVWYLLDSLIKKLVVRSLNQEEQELLFEYNAFIRRKSEAQDEEESSSARQWKISHLLSKPQVSHVRIMDQFENSNWRKRNALRRYFSPTIFKRKETPKEMESWKATGTGPYCSYQTSFSGSRDDVILNKLGHSSSEEISDTTTPSTELTETSQTVTDRTSHP